MMCAQKYSNTLGLNELLLGIVTIPAKTERLISGLAIDSREVTEGMLFIAVSGDSVDGRDFIEAAIENGAQAVVWESPEQAEALPVHYRKSSLFETDVPVIAVRNLKKKIGLIASRYFENPSASMYAVGVTGTNGKTSVTQYIAQACGNEHSAVIGTTGWGQLNALNVSTHTTPDAVRLQQWLKDIYESGNETIAMEVSSHALDQYRVSGVQFDCAVFTNLTRDHLDYHGDMESYASAKFSLFEMDGLSSAVVNMDDEYGRKIVDSVKDKLDVLTYGLELSGTKPDIYATDIEYKPDGLTFNLHAPSGSEQVNAHLYGDFSILNILATVGVLVHKNIEFDDIIRRISMIEPATGRMQCFSHTDKPLVIVDYAHTPDALLNVLNTAEKHFTGDIWTVFGCGGNRDKGKRQIMGRIAEEHSDYVILTNDNPRYEDPQSIIDAIMLGIVHRDRVHTEIDRAKAIEYAVAHADGNDVVIIAGKGHEDYQLVADQKLHFSDIEQAELILKGESV